MQTHLPTHSHTLQMERNIGRFAGELGRSSVAAQFCQLAQARCVGWVMGAGGSGVVGCLVGVGGGEGGGRGGTLAPCCHALSKQGLPVSAAHDLVSESALPGMPPGNPCRAALGPGALHCALLPCAVHPGEPRWPLFVF